RETITSPCCHQCSVSRWGRGSLQPPSDRPNAHSLQPSVVYGSALCYFVLKTECYFVLKTDVSVEELTFRRWILDYRSKKVTRRVWGGGTHYAQELRARIRLRFLRQLRERRQRSGARGRPWLGSHPHQYSHQRERPCGQARPA